ncbi:MAG TPA: glycoside hydrolase family 3 N-terminal domain-containing protein [Cyclobacteriaceae bacterium]|nr:glycoside hydrolase family 3 N-terminal domain-containing protein [Cyclobacteriaceae bacterium]
MKIPCYLLGLVCALHILTGNAQSDPAADLAKKTLASLTLEKKAAQLVCTEISGNYITDDDPKFQSWLSLARDHGVGGFVIYGGTPHSVCILLNKLQVAAGIPILISTDFEGGPGQQVAGASEFPSNMAFAAAGDPDLMYRAAKIMGGEGKALGIHLTYTPVSDVSLSPDNPQESGRSFGANMELMKKLLNAYVKGYHESGMLTTSKHFPGRGDMKGGPAYPSFTTLNKSAAELDANEFTAFRNAIDAGVDFMMTEHIAVPSITGGSMLPASVEPKLVKGVIRDKLGFKGIITSDDLWYDHVTARFGKEEVAIMALQAGHDIVLKPKDPVATIHAIVEAVKSGKLSQEQIDHSVYKLLYKKYALGLEKNKLVNIDNVSKAVGTAAHKAVVQEVADRSVTLLKNDNVLPLKNFDAAKTIHVTIQKEEDQPNVRQLVRDMAVAFPGIKQYSLKPGVDRSLYEEIQKFAEGANRIVVSLFVQRDRHGDAAPLRNEDIDLLKKLSEQKSGNVVVMSFGNPHLIRKINFVPSYIVGYGEGGFYGNQPVYFSSFIRILKGELKPSGKLPISVTREMGIGWGLEY